MALLLTLLLTAIGGMTVAGSVLKRKFELSSHCHAEVLKLQRELSKPLVKLSKLNPSAQALRAQRLTAQARLAAAIGTGNPVAIGAARAELAFVHQRQLALQLKQKTLLSEAKTLRIQFKASAPRSSQMKAFTQFPFESSTLAVEAMPPESLTPSYFPEIEFERNQAQSFRLENRYVLSMIGLQNVFKDYSRLSLTQECSATLKPIGGFEWEPKLVNVSAKKAKVSWR